MEDKHLTFFTELDSTWTKGTDDSVLETAKHIILQCYGTQHFLMGIKTTGYKGKLTSTSKLLSFFDNMKSKSCLA